MSNGMRMGDIKNRETVNVKVVSALTGDAYDGAFTWRRMKLQDYGAIAGMLSDLTDGKPLVETSTLGPLLNSIATLTVVVEKYPDWWEEIRELPDASVISAVHRQYVEWFTAPFRQRREERARAESDQGSSQQNEG